MCIWFWFQRLEVVFSCLVDISDLTITLISAVEDTLEMTEPNQVPAIGICLLELAEVRIYLILIWYGMDEYLLLFFFFYVS